MKILPLKKPFDCEISDISSDKSISHRCAIFSLLSDGVSVIENYLEASDTLNSLKIIEKLGARVEKRDGKYFITPPKALKSPSEILDCGNSGTAMRIFVGLLAGTDGFFVLSGDCYLNERPMRRVCEPLCKIGAKIFGRDNANKAPLAILGGDLGYFEFESPVASAQVKTAMILAALNGKGGVFSEPNLSRNHSENMLKSMGAEIFSENSFSRENFKNENSQNLNAENSANFQNFAKFSAQNSQNSNPLLNENPQKITLKITPLNGKKLAPLNICVPNDPSSCFFFAVAAAITPGAKITLKNVLLNKTRTQAFKILEKMGAKISYRQTSQTPEIIGEISVAHAPLKAVSVSENIAWLIDEAPALAVAFAFASGTSELKNAAELRVKESDRIAVMVKNLRKCGIEAVERPDGFLVTGGTPKFARIDSHGDHRIAMSFAILGLKCGVEIEKSEFIATSFPRFGEILASLGAKIN